MSKVKAEITQTAVDKAGRGMFIAAEITRFPNNENKKKIPFKLCEGEDAHCTGHAFSFTSQSNNGELYCTAMDPNLFFAKTRGKQNCEKLAEKMAEVLKAYDPIDVSMCTASLGRFFFFATHPLTPKNDN